MLNGKVALISEGALGIGRRIAKRLAYEGAHTILISENNDALLEVYDEIKQFGGNATIAQVDVRSINSLEELSVSINNIFKCLDILIGGVFHFGKVNLLVDYSHNDWQDAIDLNLHANWRLLKVLDPLLKASSNGRVVMSTCSYKQALDSFYGTHAASVASLEKILELYAIEVAHTNVKANLVDLANIDFIRNSTSIDDDLANDITDIFVKLSSEQCMFAGRRHYVQF